MKYFITLIILLVPQYCLAHGYYAQWGAGVMNDNQKEYSQVKYAELGKRASFRDAEYSIGMGGWIDKSHYPGAESSLYVQALAGLQPRLKNFVLGYFVGPAYITTPDKVLASNFQVSHELIIGVRDDRNVRVYFSVKHYSNAGMVLPNIGRNFAGVGIQWR